MEKIRLLSKNTHNDVAVYGSLNDGEILEEVLTKEYIENRDDEIDDVDKNDHLITNKKVKSAIQSLRFYLLNNKSDEKVFHSLIDKQ